MSPTMPPKNGNPSRDATSSDTVRNGQKCIQAPRSLLVRASQDGRYTEQALIVPSNQPVLICSGTFTQEDVDSHAWCLRSPHIGAWIQQDALCSSGTVPATADEPLRVPQIRVGPGLALRDRTGFRYVLVVQGKSGKSKAKVLVESSVQAAAETIMHEALNGYSTAFCAAFEGDLQARDDTLLAARFVAVMEGQQVEAGDGRWTIGLVCCAKHKSGTRRLCA
ncbi:hypothetical protein Q7P37_006215 [Cladosporium fusiforme]